MSTTSRARSWTSSADASPHGEQVGCASDTWPRVSSTSSSGGGSDAAWQAGLGYADGGRGLPRHVDAGGQPLTRPRMDHTLRRAETTRLASANRETRGPSSGGGSPVSQGSRRCRLRDDSRCGGDDRRASAAGLKARPEASTTRRTAPSWSDRLTKLAEPPWYDPIPDPAAPLLADDQPRLRQHLQVVRHGGLGAADRVHQVAGANLTG